MAISKDFGSNKF